MISTLITGGQSTKGGQFELKTYLESCQASMMKPFWEIVNPLMPGGNKKVTHASGLFKNV